MSYDTKEEAVTAANALRKRMKSPGWKTRVWENMGWHISLAKGNVYLYEAYDDKYHSLMHNGGCPGAGELYWSSRNYSSSDPNKVYQKQIALAQAFVKRAVNSITRSI